MRKMRKRRGWLCLLFAAGFLLWNAEAPGTGSVHAEEEKTEKEETEEIKEIKEETSEFGTEEDGKEYDFSDVTPSDEEAEAFDRYAYNPLEYQIQTLAVTGYEELSANIRKRVQWTDEENGDGKITLQYQSNSGSITGTNDMNLILVQDKSGSMDVNYGFNLELVRSGLDINNNEGIWYYPIRNDSRLTESVDEILQRDNYGTYLNGYGQGFHDGWINNQEMTFNSPCQQEDHYYLLTSDDPNSNISKGYFVHGNNLYNIMYSDLHHYTKLSGEGEALSYLAAGRRVVRANKWISESGETKYSESSVYFLDVSAIVQFNGKHYLRTCEPICEANDRLTNSMNFMNTLVQEIKTLNPENKVAYVPFWGDVPVNGSWQNLGAEGSLTNIYPLYGSHRLTYKEGVSYIGLTESGKFQTIFDQINNPFTYDGTNWTRALNKVIEILNARSSEDKKKETLVVFLTDGTPQGTAGLATDFQNPEINGVNQAAQLKAMDKVTIYACGVCINQKNSDTEARIRNLDSDYDQATFARNTSQFSTLLNTVKKRLNSQYEVEIKGQDAFYTDTLSAQFSLDESKLDASWKVLASPGSGTTKGVPTSVYNAVKNDSTIKKVYVRSTKTVYWYIGDMTNGSYSASGHEISFPIEYAGYETSSGGKDTIQKANTAQKLTYVSSANTDKLKTVEADTPSLVFNRENLPSITINKALEGSAFTTDQTYRFAYCKEKQSGKIVSKEGIVSITIKAGQTQGSTVIGNVKAGTYYIYEIDQNNTIISSQVQTAVVSQQAVITTVKASTSIPVSAVSSDGAAMNNLDNYLKITSKSAEVSFTNSYVTVNVAKVWEDSGSSRRPASVTVNLLKNGKQEDSRKITAADGWKCVFQNLPRYDVNGKEYLYEVTENTPQYYEEKIEYTETAEGRNAVITNILMTADLTVEKTIAASDGAIWWEHGNPIFTVQVTGKGLDGKEYTFYHSFEFTESYVKENQKDGMVTMSYTFRDIPNSTAYKAQEVCVSRYTLKNVSGSGEHVKIIKGDTLSGAEFFGTHAVIDLTADPDHTKVTFENEKEDYQWLSHTAHVENKIKTAE